MAWLVAAAWWAEPVHAQDRQAMSKCLDAAISDNRAKEMVLIERGLVDVLSVDIALARRRQQEAYCLQVGRCVAMGVAAEDAPLLVSTTFSSCLRDQTIEQYGLRAR